MKRGRLTAYSNAWQQNLSVLRVAAKSMCDLLHSCVYVCMYVCIYIYISMYACVYMYMYVCMYVYIYIYIYIYTCMHVIRIYTYMYVCVHSKYWSNSVVIRQPRA